MERKKRADCIMKFKDTMHKEHEQIVEQDLWQGEWNGTVPGGAGGNKRVHTKQISTVINNN